jgi:hypothetical protein
LAEEEGLPVMEVDDDEDILVVEQVALIADEVILLEELEDRPSSLDIQVLLQL